MQKNDALTSGAFIEEFVMKPYQTGVLSNLSFAVKDCIDVKNKFTGFGNPTWLRTHPKATVNAICVDLLLSEGASCVGKTITDEFAYSLIGENFFYGTPKNPKCPDRVPGGSSSGSASSVACGIVDFALGTDTGGSIRVPASNCGIYGYRPSHGKISVAGVIPLAPSLDTVGVLAKNMKILNSVASVLLGEANISNEVSNYKIVVIEEILEACDPFIRASIHQYLDNNFREYSTIKLSDIVSQDITVAWLFDLYVLLHSCEVWSMHGSWVESVKPKLGPIADYNFNNIAKLANRNQLSVGIRQREWFARKVQEYLKKDIILCFPTVPEIAPKRGFYSQNPEARTSSTYFQRLIGINAVAGLSRSPQITVPIDDTNSIPIGISFLAGQGKDKFLLEAMSSLISV